MAPALPPGQPDAPIDLPTLPVTGNGRDSDHLKGVPGAEAHRRKIRAQVERLAAELDKSRPLVRHEMEAHSLKLLGQLGLPAEFLGWTMVALASAFWHEQVAAVPYHRRLLLLPRCLRNDETCPAELTEDGLLCQDCGACGLSDLRTTAKRRGYRVMIAEGSPAVMQVILGGHADALLGVSCLDVLEKTLDKILIAGIPCMAVPLLSNGCRNTTAEDDPIRRMIETPHRPTTVRTRTYVHLMRSAARMFDAEELHRLVPRLRGEVAVPKDDDGAASIDGIEPIACTEALAYDFLAAGGKHFRPFITLAVYDALCGGEGTRVDGAERVAKIPDAVKRMALAIETFHKASLVHDDIEDNDAFRYGRPTLHRQFGTATAINVGDYLIGLGYRLVAGERGALPPDVAADVLAHFAEAHTKLCEGQGAELVWRDARDKRLAPLDALKIYALKTAPAFEAALLAGIRLAGPADPYRRAATQFSRHLGVAYQILNDLDDWQDNKANKRTGGGDVLGGRPTVLWAMALQSLDEEDRQELESLTAASSRDDAMLERTAELYARADVFRQAAALVSKHHQRAQDAADQVDSEPLRRLLRFLADAILDRRPLAVE